MMQTLSKFNSQNGRTPLYWASSRGHTAVVKILIENKADINICNKVNIRVLAGEKLRGGGFTTYFASKILAMHTV